MADNRRRGPEPAGGLPRVEHKPGMAQAMLREMAPLLAEEGIDLSGDNPPDMQTLQAALNRAVERRNLELFTPVGSTRQIAVDTLHHVVAAVLAGDSTTAERLLDQVQPESPDNSAPTVSSCIGIALGVLDEALTAADAPTVTPPPDTGPVNGPPPTSSSWHAREKPSDPSTSCSSDAAGRTSSAAPHSPSPPPSRPSPAPPTHPPKTSRQPSSADPATVPAEQHCCDDDRKPPG